MDCIHSERSNVIDESYSHMHCMAQIIKTRIMHHHPSFFGMPDDATLRCILHHAIHQMKQQPSVDHVIDSTIQPMLQDVDLPPIVVYDPYSESTDIIQHYHLENAVLLQANAYASRSQTDAESMVIIHSERNNI